jgi:alpha/beta superfamily hydrolase
LEALLDEPAPERGVSPDGYVERGRSSGLRAAVVLGHPHPQHGGTMHTKAVYQAAKALARIGCVVLRFNFRGAGKSAGSFDKGGGERDDFLAALDFMTSQYPDVPVWAGGMSFGSWVGLTVGAADPRVTLLLGLAVPVNRYDFGPVAASTKPKFLIHGERDEICPLKDIREFYSRAEEPKELVVIDAADHLFDGRVGEVADAIEELLGDWTT